jgi:hypothetical protein
MTVWEWGDTFDGVMSEIVLTAVLDWLVNESKKAETIASASYFYKPTPLLE